MQSATQRKIIQNYTVVSPAYGRDYKSKAAAIDDFKAGLDFRYHGFGGGAYCSIRDFSPGIIVNIRYKKLTLVAPFTVPTHDALPDAFYDANDIYD